MSSKPLQPFAPPTALFSHLPSGFALTWTLYAVFIFWAILTLIAIYHWLKYSHASWVAVPAIVLHLFVSLSLMSYALSGIFIL